MDKLTLPWGHEWIDRKDEVSKGVRIDDPEMVVLRECLQRLIKPEFQVMDIGAHHGYVTLLASTLCKFVISFEPSKREFDALNENIKINGVENVVTFQTAMTGEVGRAEFQVVQNQCTGCNTFRPWHSLKRVVKSELVNTCNLDSLLFPMDLIKIDAEGAELDILKGGVLTIKERKPIIITELHTKRTKPWGYMPQEITKFLTDLGYVWFHMDGSEYTGKIDLDAYAVHGDKL